MADEINPAIMGQANREDLAGAGARDPARPALLVVTLQYDSGCHTMGLGKKFTEEGQGHLAAWRFDRIEQLVVPNLQTLRERGVGPDERGVGARRLEAAGMGRARPASWNPRRSWRRARPSGCP